MIYSINKFEWIIIKTLWHLKQLEINCLSDIFILTIW